MSGNPEQAWEETRVAMTDQRFLQIARLFLRFALGITFLGSIADRFGLLGHYGSRNVSWGDWKHFVQYVAVLNWFVPKALINGVAILETIIECALGIALLIGLYPRIVAWSSAALLISFAMTMSVALGVVAPLSYSVFSAAGGALLLGAVAVPRDIRSSSQVRTGPKFSSSRLHDSAIA